MRALHSLYILLFFAFLSGISLTAYAQESATITILHANQFRPGTATNKNVLTGNVKLAHQDIIVYCDSLYQFTDTNYIEAYGNVHVIQNDSLHLWGDFMSYNGDTQKSIVRRNVRMNNGEVTLYTHFLDYDMDTNIGYYFNVGTLKDSLNTLISELGYYYVNEDKLFFKDSVKVYTPDYNMYSDTLIYHTESKIVTIAGPTNIIGTASNLYSEDGWYNTITAHIELYKENNILYNEYLAIADTIVIDSISGVAIMKENVHLYDSVNKIITEGHYGELHNDTEYAFVVDQALLILIGDNDSLFIHADTLSHYTVRDSSQTNKLLKAFYHTKFFNTDLQGVCDSMTYNVNDSTIYLNGTPIVWASGNQLTANYIDMLVSNNTIKEFHLNEKAMIVNQVDSNKFNQIKGRNMIGHVKNNELYLVDVNGNGESLYFYEEDNDLMLNKALSAYIKIYINKRQITDIEFINNIEGSLTPFFLIKEDDLYLSEFKWHIDKKPLRKEDIFSGKRSFTNKNRSIRNRLSTPKQEAPQLLQLPLKEMEQPMLLQQEIEGAQERRSISRPVQLQKQEVKE